MSTLQFKTSGLFFIIACALALPVSAQELATATPQTTSVEAVATASTTPAEEALATDMAELEMIANLQGGPGPEGSPMFARMAGSFVSRLASIFMNRHAAVMEKFEAMAQQISDMKETLVSLVEKVSGFKLSPSGALSGIVLEDTQSGTQYCVSIINGVINATPAPCVGPSPSAIQSQAATVAEAPAPVPAAETPAADQSDTPSTSDPLLTNIENAAVSADAILESFQTSAEQPSNPTE